MLMRDDRLVEKLVLANVSERRSRPRKHLSSFPETKMQNHLSAKLLAEFIGTFAFVFIGAGAAAVVGAGAGLNGIAAIAFAHGLTIMVFAFAYGSLSGAHFNPAVTVGVLAARAMSLGEAIGYIISQIVAAACAAFLLRAVLGGVETGLGRPELAQGVVLGATTLTITPAAGFVIEAVLAFFLVIVVLTTAVARSAGNLAPLAIGMTVALNIMMAGALTGANFNPAISLGPMIATANFTNAWLYVIAPVVGALVATVIYKVLNLLAQGGSEVASRAAAPAE
jgi:MIP family channel proteins